MKIIPLLAISVLILVSSCTESPQEVEEINKESIVEDISDLEKLDSAKIAQAVSDSIELKQYVDSVSLGDSILIGLQTEFLYHLKNRDFDSVQAMLFSEGVYYYTVGRIAKKDFDLKGIKKSKGILDGAYSDCEDCPEKKVDGTYWLDSITAKLIQGSGYVHSVYGAVGFGFSGNYCSDNISNDILNVEEDAGVYSDPPYRVIYSYYDKGELSPEYLMLEFVLENEEWKVYAIGNLEWTP